jgi:hypothetical protein
MSNELTMGDIVRGMKMENPMDQQVFFLSRFFNLTQRQVEDTPYQDIYPMIEEMNKYFKKIEPLAFFDKADWNDHDEKIDSRTDILDIRE